MSGAKKENLALDKGVAEECGIASIVIWTFGGEDAVWEMTYTSGETLCAIVRWCEDVPTEEEKQCKN